MRWIERAHQLAQDHPQQVSVLYGDELSFYRRPSLTGGGTYHPCSQEPIFETVAGYNTRHRVGAAMDAYTGRVVWVDNKVVGVQALCLLLERIRALYGKERTIFLIWDNWHIHYQKEVATKAFQLGIQLLWLPTYAPWTNPIEKMWRWLKQTHVHNHTLATDFDTLKERVRTFLSTFGDGSAYLLRYVGLLPHPDPAITRLTC
jgi:transposase